MVEQRNALTITTPSDREIVMTRIFDARRELVFEAHSKCEHLANWWGPRKYALVVCELDFRPGGAYRFVQRGPDGEEHGFRGEFREIVPPERIVQTFEYEGMPATYRSTPLPSNPAAAGPSSPPTLSSTPSRTATPCSSRAWRKVRRRRGTGWRSTWLA